MHLCKCIVALSTGLSSNCASLCVTPLCCWSQVCSQGDCGLIASDQEEAASVGSIVQDKPSSAEDLNQFAFVVDADEDGDRIKFSDLLKQDTPVLKQVGLNRLACTSNPACNCLLLLNLLSRHE